jgi:uncharacterized protein YutD
MTTNGSLVEIFKLVIAFQRTFDAKRLVRDFRDIGGELLYIMGGTSDKWGLIRRGFGRDSTLA